MIAISASAASGHSMRMGPIGIRGKSMGMVPTPTSRAVSVRILAACMS